jgi:hypothetical protein
MIDPQSSETRGNGADEIRAGSAAEPEGSLPHGVQTLVDREARVREFIRSHPLPVVLGAFALGFAVARWMLRTKEYR